jgi:hypothetical protein
LVSNDGPEPILLGYLRRLRLIRLNGLITQSPVQGIVGVLNLLLLLVVVEIVGSLVLQGPFIERFVAITVELILPFLKPWHVKILFM